MENNNHHRFHPNLYIKDRFLVEEDDKGNTHKVARAIDLRRRIENIDDGTIQLEVAFYDASGNEQVVTLPREEIFGNRIANKLVTLGADITSDVSKKVMQYLRDAEGIAEACKVHSHLGFATYKGKKIFKHAITIGDCTSKYMGDLNIEPRGTFAEQMAVINEHILGHSQQELAFALGLSGTLLPIISKDADFPVLCVHFKGGSSSGKSTAACTAVSAFSYPDTNASDAPNESGGIQKNGGLMRSWFGTLNSLFSSMTNKNGLTMVLDETSMHEEDDLANVIYTLAGGQEKGRLTDKSVMMKSARWSGTIISTAEFSLLEHSKRNEGIHVRLAEFSNVEWTESAEHADAIKKGLKRAYGHTGPKFVEHLLTIGPQNTIKIWNQWRTRCTEILKQAGADKFVNRIADRYAVIMAATEIAEEVFDIELDKAGILNLLTDAYIEASPARNIAGAALSHLEGYIACNPTLFPPKGSSNSYKEISGVMTGNEQQRIALIVPEKLKQILSTGNFTNTDVILHKWRDDMILSCTDKFTKQYVLTSGGNQTRVHVINLPATEKDNSSRAVVTDKRRPVPKVTVPKTPKRPGELPRKEEASQAVALPVAKIIPVPKVTAPETPKSTRVLRRRDDSSQEVVSPISIKRKLNPGHFVPEVTYPGTSKRPDELSRKEEASQAVVSPAANRSFSTPGYKLPVKVKPLFPRRSKGLFGQDLTDEDETED
ncbi:MAG: DUF927 domain-containing protein [bacterium]